jgi:LPXTG-motif cell wall-anchored protein
LNKLPASADNSDINIGDNQYLFLIIIIILGTVSFLFIKRKKDKSKSIEEEVSADNFKILE